MVDDMLDAVDYFCFAARELLPRFPNSINEMERKNHLGVGIALGAGVGTAMGVALGNIAIGLAIGTALGAVVGALLSGKKGGDGGVG